MNQATTYAPARQSEGAASAVAMFREFAAVMPIVILYKAMRTAYGKR
ncbi:MAG: hypothetical protein JSS14_03625 [Proteobacteria bacterium]|nr:hypothetical protein [Pseudomonadota bacterium]